MRLLALTMLIAGCAVENEVNDLPEYDIESMVKVPEAPEPEQPRFYTLDVPYAPAVADDGTVLLFDWRTGGDVYLWNEATGLDWVTTTGAYFNSVDDISADGNVIIGSYGNYMADEDTQAAIWTDIGGWVKLGALPDTLDCPMQSSGWSLTEDGTVAAGLAFEGCSAFAFRWDADNGMVPYDQVGNGGNRATRISGDGSLAVGFAQGDSNRTPAVWYDDGTGEVLNMAFTGEFYDVNGDGTVAVGQLGSKAFAWVPGEGHSILGTLGAPGQTSSSAYAVCGDDLILGTDSLYGGVATAWTEETGLVSLQEYLEELGMEFPTGARLTSANACTPDKRVLVGSGGEGDEGGVWIAVLPFGFLDQ